MTTVLPADQAARDRLLNELDTTFFVEAGAGTGKTTALVSRIVELVARDGLQMERLTAITFTEAAAAELRDRIRQDLEKAALSRTDEGERTRCTEASRQVDVAAIQTIHAFAGALVRTFPLEAGLPPNFSMLDELEQERLFDNRFREWLYDEVPDHQFPQRRAAVRRVLALGMTPDQLRALATGLQDYGDLIEPTTVWPHPATDDPVAVARRWGTELEVAVAAEHEAFDPEDKLAIELRRLRSIAERMTTVEDNDDALRLLRECDPRSQGGNQSNWPTGRCRELKAVLKQCADELESQSRTIAAPRWRTSSFTCGISRWLSPAVANMTGPQRSTISSPGHATCCGTIPTCGAERRPASTGSSSTNSRTLTRSRWRSRGFSRLNPLRRRSATGASCASSAASSLSSVIQSSRSTASAAPTSASTTRCMTG